MKKRSELYKTIELSYCKAITLVSQDVIESMNKGPCFLGSEKFFEQLEKDVRKSLKSSNKTGSSK